MFPREYVNCYAWICMHARIGWLFLDKSFHLVCLCFFLFLSFYQRIDCSDVQEHIYLHPYGSRITNSISKCIHFTVWERKFPKKNLEWNLSPEELEIYWFHCMLNFVTQCICCQEKCIFSVFREIFYHTKYFDLGVVFLVV